MSWLEYNKKINKNGKEAKPVSKEPKPLAVVPPRPDEGREIRLYEVKKRVHHCLLERLDLSQLEELDEKLRAKEIRQAISMLLEEEKEPLNMRERARLAREMEFEILGLGPLEPLLMDPTISDILVNRFNQVYVERKGRAGTDGSALSGQRPPLKNYQQDRQQCGPADRRIGPHG